MASGLTARPQSGTTVAATPSGGDDLKRDPLHQHVLRDLKKTVAQHKRRSRAAKRAAKTRAAKAEGRPQ